MRDLAKRERRGTALAAAVLILAVLNIMIAASLRGTGGDAQLDALRAQSLRARAAAESGLVVVAKHVEDGLAVPSSVTLPGGAVAVIASVDDPGGSGLGTIDVSLTARDGSGGYGATASIRR